MRINIFRNPFIDTQVGMLIDAYEDGLRKQTESYWTKEIVIRLKQRIINEICASPGDDQPCNICGGLELALMIIDDEFGV